TLSGSCPVTLAMLSRAASRRRARSRVRAVLRASRSVARCCASSARSAISCASSGVIAACAASARAFAAAIRSFIVVMLTSEVQEAGGAAASAEPVDGAPVPENLLDLELDGHLDPLVAGLDAGFGLDPLAAHQD